MALAPTILMLSINKQTAINPFHVNSAATCKLEPETSVLMPINLQILRQVQLSNAKISKEIKMALYKLLQKYYTIISKSNNDIGQTDLIEIHIATRPDSAHLQPDHTLWLSNAMIS